MKENKWNCWNFIFNKPKIKREIHGDNRIVLTVVGTMLQYTHCVYFDPWSLRYLCAFLVQCHCCTNLPCTHAVCIHRYADGVMMKSLGIVGLHLGNHYIPKLVTHWFDRCSWSRLMAKGSFRRRLAIILGIDYFNRWLINFI